MCPELQRQRERNRERDRQTWEWKLNHKKAKIVRGWIEMSHLLIRSDDFHSSTNDIYQYTPCSKSLSYSIIGYAIMPLEQSKHSEYCLWL